MLKLMLYFFIINTVEGVMSDQDVLSKILNADNEEITASTKDSEAKFDQYGRLFNPNYDPLSLEKESDCSEQDTNSFESSKKPQMKFNHETLEFEYADENIQKIHDLRRRIQAQEHDPLEMKQIELAQGLRDIGFSEKDMGKTGDSRTGQVTERHRAIAASQIEDAKQVMLRRRLSKEK